MSPTFKLGYTTPVEWVARVEQDLCALLSDHAHCELKAATTAQTLISKNPQRTELVERLSAMAIEEMQHFRQAIALLQARGGVLGKQLPNPYAVGLHKGLAAERRSSFLDRLLIAALIEARSLERFTLLAEHLRDRDLAAVYAELCKSEAGHRKLFLQLARNDFPRAEVDQRWEQLQEIENGVLAGLPFEVRMHSGMNG